MATSPTAAAMDDGDSSDKGPADVGVRPDAVQAHTAVDQEFFGGSSNRANLTGEMWTVHFQCKRPTAEHPHIQLKLDKGDINFLSLLSIKEQLGYAGRDYLYYKKRCGTDVAMLQSIDYTRDPERMVHEYAEERKIRLVLSKEQQAAQQVSITPLKRPRQQPEDEEHPFMDDPFDAFKD